MGVDNIAQDAEIGSFTLTVIALIFSVSSIGIYWKTIQLLAEALPLDGARYRLTYRYCRALWTLVTLRGRDVKPQAVYDLARQRIEHEIACPRPNDDEGLSRQEFKDAKEKWRLKFKSSLLPPSQKLPLRIAVGNPTLLIKNHQYLKRYFDVLHKQKPNETVGFATLLEIDTGFVAPLHLLRGLIYKYDEDWGKIVDRYGHDTTHDPDQFGNLSIRKFQVFTFDCWLLWGPSIPLCSCRQWEGNPALQFGYGDENNSLAIRGENPDSALEVLRPHAPGALAWKARATGSLRWGPAVPQADVCLAQEGIWNKDEERLLLDIAVPGGGVKVTGENAYATYYSAYIWIIFVMCDRKGKPFHPHPDRRWRDLIPFFIHGNIAEPETYDIQTDELARGAADSMVRLIEENEDLTFQFACAIDETACGSAMTVAALGDTIRDKMRNYIGSDKTDRIRLNLAADGPFANGHYSACALNGIVHSYYRDRPWLEDRTIDANGLEESRLRTEGSPR
ncbi:hypothetical protein GPX89_09775 [Nocardia sp. ET3-3]|uniref:Uncharacterized protein n=1 Tax=Nocardia terrae TaxID=2675851 RepID=A0A7K1UT51_9NOCA|nr:hypothetical protein [Nocardia terrae]MVU77532.1 hypothetical protein [Nocardia terrae]